MSTVKHTPLPFGGPLTAAAMEAPLGELDAAIAAIIVAGSAVATTLTSTATTGTAGPFNVASTAGLFAGDVVYFGGGALYEQRIVNTVPSGTTFTTTANLTNTYASGKPVSKSPVELVDARGSALTLAARLLAIDASIAGGSSAATEVTNARGGAANLKARLDTADSKETADIVTVTALATNWTGVVIGLSPGTALPNTVLTTLTGALAVDGGDPFDFVTVGAPSLITIPAGKGGVYRFSGAIAIAVAAAVGTYRIGTIRKNGVVATAFRSGGNANAQTFEFAWSATLAAGDVVDFQAQHDGTGSPFGAVQYLLVERVGPAL